MKKASKLRRLPFQIISREYWESRWRETRYRIGVMASKLQDRLGYPPRGMRLERAAAYLDIGKTKFLELVEEGRLSKPVRVDGLAIWDRLQLDADFDALQNEEPRGRRNTVDMVLGLK